MPRTALSFAVCMLAVFLLPRAAGAGSWSAMTSPVGTDLHAVWGTNWDDVWAAGNATVLHYDGTGWSLVADADTVNGTGNIPDQVYRGIWAIGPKVWAGGDNGTVVHYDGSTWTNQTTGEPYTLNGLWGAADNDIWAAADNASLYHFDGSSWSFVNDGTGVTADYSAIHGRSAGAIYVAAMDPGNNTAIYYDGSSWSSLGNATNDTSQAAVGVWADPASSDAWFVTNSSDNATVYKHDGGSWSDTTNGTFSDKIQRDIFGLASDDIYVVGDEDTINATIRHWDGSSWSGQAAPGNKEMHSVWGTTNSTLYRVYAVGSNGTIWVYENGLPVISSITAVPSSGPTPLDVTFTCTASDPDGSITAYRWDVNGDSSIDYVGSAGNSTLDHTYSSAGSFNATCTVVDDKLQTSIDGVSVNATGPNKPPLVYSVIASPDNGAVPLYVSFTCSASDDDGSVYYFWDFDGDGSTDNSTNSSNTYFTYNATGTYYANCTVYDVYNATTTVLKRIDAHSNNPPSITGFSATPLTGDVPLKVTFQVGATSDNPLSHYAFTFGDNSTTRIVNATLTNSTTYVYTTEETVNATVQAYDSMGLYDTSSSVQIEVRPTKTGDAPTQSGVSTISVDTQDSYPMSSSAVIANHNIADGNFTSLTEVREFTSTIVPASATGTYRYKVTGLSQAVYELRLYKLLGGNNIPFAYADSATPGVDGAWWLTEEDGTTYVSASSTLSGGSIYYVYFCVRDNGSYDLNDTPGSIRDPQVLGSSGLSVSGGLGGGGGGGGGCSAGAHGPGQAPGRDPGMAVELVLLLALAGVVMACRRRKGR